ncbi:hypothetical protein [Actinoplanes couchii]|uniref:DUF4062 domain-containing protein n=1 Tax=Actinoplanes couchii TaxID=403638 RepID=A0ABQ3XCT4_9ACTN|nr:hypothetical protein [Actinoplanes couchii]MDR6321191.1 hypothetical protein [Actinoplanes couchii]GID56299.1 hypothetical protein Aco03nite_047030 [Actinoplanes couchii]
MSVHGAQFGNNNTQNNDFKIMLNGEKVLVGFTEELENTPKDRSFATAALEAAAIPLATSGARLGSNLTARQYRDRMKEIQNYVFVVGLRYGQRVWGRPWKSYPQLGIEIARRSGKPYLIILISGNGNFSRADDFNAGDTSEKHRQNLLRDALREKHSPVVVDSVAELETEMRKFLQNPQTGSRSRPRLHGDHPLAIAVLLGGAGFAGLWQWAGQPVGQAALAAGLAGFVTFMGGRKWSG